MVTSTTATIRNTSTFFICLFLSFLQNDDQ
jgi:hypothetical protein